MNPVPPTAYHQSVAGGENNSLGAKKGGEVSGVLKQAAHGYGVPAPSAGTWWIDDIGRWHLLDPTSPRAPERSQIPDNALCNDLMYRFYGMLRVENDKRNVRLSWDVTHVCTRAMEVACDFLKRLRAPVTLRFFFGGWTEESYRDAAEAEARLRWTRAYAGVSPILRTAVRNRPLSEIRGRHDPFGLLLHSFQVSGGLLTPDLHNYLDRQRLTDELVLFETSSESGDLLFKHIGSASVLALLYGQDWSADAIGRRYDATPCTSDATRVLSGSYMSVIDSGTPRYDHVRALVEQESQEGCWVPYQRLLYPYRLPDQRKGILLFSRLTQAISIPFMGRRGI